MEKTIQLFKTYVHQEAKDNVLRVLDSGWLGLGPETEAFEKEVCEYIGSKYAIAMNSGTEALRIATWIAARDTRAGYAPATPNTFVASNSVLVQNNIYPIFTDIDCSTGLMKEEDVVTALEKYSCGMVMLVHYGGYPANMDFYRSIEESYNVDIIHDCAHAFGASYKGKRLGSDMKYGCFSFHAVKPLALGDGGMLVTNDEEVDTLARKLRWFGINKSTAQRTNMGNGMYGWEYDVEMLGWKSHMNDIQAAIGRGQLKHFEGDNRKREEIANRYRKNLYSCHYPRVIAPCEYRNSSSNHLMVVLFENKIKREEAMARLRSENIQFGYHYKPNYLYEDFKDYTVIGTLGMEKFYETALSMPMHLEITEEDVDRICDIIGG